MCFARPASVIILCSAILAGCSQTPTSPSPTPSQIVLGSQPAPIVETPSSSPSEGEPTSRKYGLGSQWAERFYLRALNARWPQFLTWMVGGILLGLIEAIGSGYIGVLTGGVLGSHYSDIFAFIVLIIMLTLRPSGLLGERVADRA